MMRPARVWEEPVKPTILLDSALFRVCHPPSLVRVWYCCEPVMAAALHTFLGLPWELFRPSSQAQVLPFAYKTDHAKPKWVRVGMRAFSVCDYGLWFGMLVTLNPKLPKP